MLANKYHQLMSSKKKPKLTLTNKTLVDANKIIVPTNITTKALADVSKKKY